MTDLSSGYAYYGHFPEWSDLLDYVENAPINFPVEARAKSCRSRAPESGGDGNSWSQVKDWPEAMELARNGWPEGTAKIENLSTSMFTYISKYATRPEPAYVTEGTSLDVGRWHDGEPEHWITMTESDNVLVNGKTTAKIGVNLSASCGISADVMVARGAAVVGLARLLDYLGIRTEIYIFSSISSDYRKGQKLLFSALVKSANQDFDITRLAFSLAHPAMLRRLVFAWIETIPEDLLDTFHIYPSAMYGYPAEPSQSTLDSYNFDVFLGEAMWGEVQWATPRKAQEWVVGELRKLGIELTLPTESKYKDVPAPTPTPYMPAPTPKPKRRYAKRRF